MRKGYAILMDSIMALVAVVIIFMALSGLTYTRDDSSSISFQRLHYVSEDTMDSLNKKGILDQVGEDWAAANGNVTSGQWVNASIMSSAYLDAIIPSNIGYQLTIENELVANNTRGVDPSSAIAKTHSIRLLVGYGRGLPTRGNVARSFLSNIKEKQTSAYTYFGGYVGQGNVTVFVSNIPSDATIQRCCLELNTPSDFELRINNQSVGVFNPSGGNMSANLHDPGDGCIDASQLSNILPGSENRFDLLFTLSNISEQYIGGGFVHVLYNTSQMDTDEISKTGYYRFPGIKGIINLYDSFYVPGRLQSMDILLHFKSNYSNYLTIGSYNIFNSTGNNSEQYVNITNQNLLDKGLVYYPDMSQKTIPLRMGTGNLSYTVVTANADIILATDLSGSMSGSKLDDAQEADRQFVNALLNTTGNRVGLVSYGNARFENSTETTKRWKDCCNSVSGYYCTNWICKPYLPLESYNDTSYIRPDRYEDTGNNGYSDAKIDVNLTTNKTVLNNTINNYAEKGGTCIACGIHAGVKELLLKGNAGKTWVLVLMTDGQATMAPINALADDNYSMDSYMPQNYSSGSDYSLTGFNAAVEAAREAYEEYGIKIYTVGFGSGVKQDDLIAIAMAGNGSYYFTTNRSGLINTFLNISEQIEKESKKSQTVFFGSSLNPSVLYPDSFITYDYLPENISGYGEISLTRQTERFNNDVNCTGVIDIPPNVLVSSVKVTSYSAEHWTDYLRLQNSAHNDEVYMLWRDYGDNYQVLGDPYAVEIPYMYVISGENNTVTIGTGDNSTSRTGCSPDDRGIYTIRLQSLVGYGNVFPESDGCRWSIEFEDGSVYAANIPSSYNGTFQCNYTQANTGYNDRDAMADAVHRLMEHLDVNNNGRVDLMFDPSMVGFELGRAGGVKSLWGPAEFKLILWM